MLQKATGATIFFMPYAAAKNTLKGSVDRLEGSDAVAWKVEAEMLHDCILSLRQMSSAFGRSVGSGSSEDPSDAAKLEMVITHAEAMQKALWSHNRTAALEHGRAAIAVL